MRFTSRHRWLLAAIASVIFAGASAQRSVETLLQPLYDSAAVAAIMIDTLVTDTSQVSMLAPRVSQMQSAVTYNLDPSRMVGDIPYRISEVIDGQISLSVPVETFASAFEMAPQLTLHYSSRGGLSFMGMGWSITGLSSIDAVNKNFFIDGNSDGGTQLYGPWALNGNRLIEQGTDDQGRQFLTQSSNVKVVLKQNGNFVAYQPDGSICTYATSNSINYSLQSVTDRQGRVMTYTYINSGNRDLLETVTFGEGRSLVFNYEDASNSRQRYAAGVCMTYHKRLSRIDVLKGGNILRRYIITYHDTSIESPISRIDMQDGNGNAVNPLCLFYQGEQAAHGVESRTDLQLGAWFPFSDPESVIATRGKLDYGCEDDAVVMFPNLRSYYIREDKYIRNDYTDSHNIIINYGLDRYPQNNHETIMAGEGFIDAFCMDVDGDGVDELVKVSQEVVNNAIFSVYLDHLQFDVYRFGVYGMHLAFTRHLYLNTADKDGKHSIWPTYFLTGDFTGDGRQELVLCRTANPLRDVAASATMKMMDLSSGSTLYSGALEAFQVNIYDNRAERHHETNEERARTSDRLFATDLDGDGKLEMCILNNSGLDIYRFSFNEVGTVTCTKSSNSLLTRSNAHDYAVNVGDTNGDGLTDIILLPNVPGKFLKSYFSNGLGQFIGQTVNLQANSQTSMMCFDFDQDGKTDIIRYYLTNDGTVMGNYVNIFTIKDGIALSDYSIQRTMPSILIPIQTFGNSSNTHLAMVKGNSKCDIYRCDDPKSMDALMTAVADSRGRVSQMEYRQLYQGEYYQPGFSAAFPYSTYAGGLFVCSAINTSAGGVTERDLSFEYQNATIHKQGLGFCGFRGITTHDNLRNETMSQTFNPENFGVPVTMESTRESHNYVYQTSLSADKRIQTVMKNDTATDLTTGVTAITTYTHDSYGNVLTSTTTYPGGIVKSVTSEYHNVDTDGVWLVGLERRHTESITRGGETATEGRTTHYNTAWLPGTVINWRGSEQHPVSTQAIRYDTQKRPDRIRTRAYSGDWLTRHIGYTDTSRLPQFVSDEQGIRTTMT